MLRYGLIFFTELLRCYSDFFPCNIVSIIYLKKCLFVSETPISYFIDNFLFMFSFSDAKTQNAELWVESRPASTSLQPLSSSFPRSRFPAFFWHPFVNAFTPFY